MKTEIIETLPDNLPFKQEWDKLVETAGNSVFSRYSFIKNWLRAYGDLPNINPQITLAYSGNDLVGIAPLVKEDGALKFAGGIDYKVAFDYCDFIVHPEFIFEVMEPFSQILLENKFALYEIPERSKALGYLRAAKVGNMNPASNSYAIELPKTWEEYLSFLNPSHRKNLLYYMRRAERDLPNFNKEFIVSEIECNSPGTENLLKSKLNEFFMIHQRRWTEMKEKAGCFAEDEKHRRFRNFHEMLSMDVINDKPIFLAFIRDGEVPMAVSYGFFDRNSIYDYLNGMNPDYKKYSPGTLVVAYEIRSAIEQGFKKFDFLRGDEPYKKDFGAVRSANFNVTS